MGQFLAQNWAIFGPLLAKKPFSGAFFGQKGIHFLRPFFRSNGAIFWPIFGQKIGQFLDLFLVKNWSKNWSVFGQFLVKKWAIFWATFGQKPLFSFLWKKWGRRRPKTTVFRGFWWWPKTPFLGTFWPKTPTGDGLGFKGFSNSYPVGGFGPKNPFLDPSGQKSRRETGVKFQNFLKFLWILLIFHLAMKNSVFLLQKSSGTNFTQKILHSSPAR